MSWVDDFDRQLERIPVAADLRRPQPTWRAYELANDALIAAWLRIGELQARVEELELRQIE